MATRNAEFFVFQGIPWNTKGNFAGNNSGTNECIFNQIDDVPRNSQNEPGRFHCLPDLPSRITELANC